MSTISDGDSKRMYSWWWDSHVSPKNSKWLQENLTEMDDKVKQMIKLIEEDADSFARRAEMYYKKRPELLNLVEEFYRAYRALAERYSHATGVIHQAHQTIAKAFPSQDPLEILDDLSGSGFASDHDLHTPDVPLIHGIFEHDELQKDSYGVSPSDSYPNPNFEGEDSEQMNELSVSGERSNNANSSTATQIRTRLDFQDADELQVLTLKNVLARLEDEKKTDIFQYEQGLERLCNLETEISQTKEDSNRLREQACRVEAEVQNLKKTLAILVSKREASLSQWQQCLDQISSHKNREEGSREVEIIAQSVENIDEQTVRDDEEVENLKRALVKITEEKEAALIQCQERLQEVFTMRHELSSIQETVERLHGDRDLKLKNGEEWCALHLELQKLVQIMATQREDKLQNRNHILNEDEKVKMEKKKSSGEICSWKETIGKLGAEVKHVAAQRNEEIYCLKDELNDYKKKNKSNMEQMLKISASVKKFQHEMKMLGEAHQRGMEENISFVVNSLSDLNAELEQLQEKSKALEESCELLSNENSTLVRELDAAIGTTAELEGLRLKSRSLEELCTLLEKEKSELVAMRESVISQMEEQLLEEKAKNDEINFSILKIFVKEMEEKNVSLLLEYQKQLEASKSSDKLVFELKRENIELGFQIQILHDANQACNNIADDEEEKHEILLGLSMENFVLIALLRQQQHERQNLMLDENGDDRNLTSTREQMMQLENQNRKLVKMNTDLDLELKNKHEQTRNMKEENDELVRQKRSLMELISRLEDDAFAETISEGILFLVFRNMFMQNRAETDLADELRKVRIGADMRLSHARELLDEMQVYVDMQEQLCRGKVLELIEAYTELEEKYTAQGMENDRLGNTISTMEDECRTMKTQLEEYAAASISVSDCVSSLETTVRWTMLPCQREEAEETQDEVTAIHSHNQQHAVGEEVEETDVEPARLHNLPARIKAIEETMISTRTTARTHLQQNQKIIDARAEPEAPENGRSLALELLQQKKHSSELCEKGNEVMEKEILLDQNCGRASNGAGSGEDMEEANLRMLKLWEASGQEVAQSASIRGDKGHHGRRDPPAEAAAMADEGSDISTGQFCKPSSLTGNRIIMLQRLVYDGKMLANLKAAIDDLKKNVDAAKRRKRGGGVEYGIVKDQVQESEEAVVELLDLNGKLTMAMEEDDDSFQAKKLQRQHVYEQWRRSSEKIGRLELELQKLQLLLLKIEYEKKDRRRPINAERRIRVALEDYLHGPRRTSSIAKGRGRVPFCLCMRMPKMED